MANRILIIEDDKDMLEMLKIIFQDSGFDVVLSSTGLTTQEVRIIHPDLILTDVHLNNYDLTGDKICKELKDQPDTHLIPVYLVSSEENLKNIAEDCHADGYFSKPFDIVHLKQVVMEKLS